MKLADSLVGVINEALMPRLRTKIEDLLPKIPAKASGEQITAMLRNNGVTDEEIKWTKMGRILAQPKVTKDEIVDHLRQYGLPFEVHDEHEATNQHRYSDYALKGGKPDSYGEKLFRLRRDEKPYKLEWVKLPAPTYGDVDVQYNGYKPGADYSGKYNPPEQPLAQVFIDKEDSTDGAGVSARCVDELGYLKDRAYNKSLRNAPSDKIEASIEEAKAACEMKLGKIFNGLDSYSSNHWGAKDPLFHVRHQEFTDADGKRLWLIEEIQSDWHQQGRKRGYSDGKQKYQILHNNSPLPVDQDSGNEFTSKEDAEAYVKSTLPASMHGGISYRAYGATGIPDAPMKKSWEEMAFKWALHQAVEAQADRIGWITGEIAADRFDISKQVDRIRIVYTREKYPNAPASHAPMSVYGYKDGHTVVNKPINSEEELPGIVGKDVAKKLLDQPKTDFERSLNGESLKVGGEGMKAAYDQRIVSIAKKIAKQTGAMVGKVALPGAKNDKAERSGPPQIEPLGMKNAARVIRDQHSGVYWGSQGAPSFEDEEDQEKYESDGEKFDSLVEALCDLLDSGDPQKIPDIGKTLEEMDEVESEWDDTHATNRASEIVTRRIGWSEWAMDNDQPTLFHHMKQYEHEEQEGTVHEVWYMELNDKVRDLVAGGMRATFESEKPRSTKPWWVI